MRIPNVLAIFTITLREVPDDDSADRQERMSDRHSTNRSVVQ